ncbi:hypothetical protein NQ315_001775 [Exocentrus adspersus]|uniref:Uncharacterized protein n=1 Tax=Exocentrus adspersus TaxID=1586481 RepID=A0AAV8WAH4_9CUCU|nr:hypothetical protein NQ315_001775 [Exocentrus adspersus]
MPLPADSPRITIPIPFLGRALLGSDSIGYITKSRSRPTLLPGRERHDYLLRRLDEPAKKEDRRAPQETTQPAGWSQDKRRSFEGLTPTGSSGRGRFGIGSTSTRRPGLQKLGKGIERWSRSTLHYPRPRSSAKNTARDQKSIRKFHSVRLHLKIKINKTQFTSISHHITSSRPDTLTVEAVQSKKHVPAFLRKRSVLYLWPSDCSRTFIPDFIGVTGSKYYTKSH